MAKSKKTAGRGARPKMTANAKQQSPFGGFGGEYWERYFKNVYIAAIDLFADHFERALPSEEEISTLADNAQEEATARLEQWATEGTDPATLYEQGFDAGLEMYQGLHRMRQGIRNLFSVGLYHLFEQQIFELHRLCLEWGFKGKATVSRAEASLKHQFGIDIRSLSAWNELEDLRLVANCAKHSEGSPADSCAKLRTRRPELFMRPEVDPNYIYPETLQRLAGEGLYVTLEQLQRFVESVKSFWTDLGSMIRSL